MESRTLTDTIAARPVPAAGSGSRATIAALIALAALGWVLTGLRMAGMDAGPGTDPGVLGFFLSTWIVMMAAMMLPSVVPALLDYRSRLAERSLRRSSAGAASASFVAGYLAAWAAAGLLGFTVLEAGRSLDGGLFAWDRYGPWLAGGVLLGAAAYELTPLKRRCLTECRRSSTAEPVPALHAPVEALRAGVEHGGWCLGCCWALMAALFALGSMSLIWMAVITAVITAQKLLPWAAATLVASVPLLAVLAIGLALAPSSVPGLTIPGGAAAIRAMRAMDTPAPRHTSGMVAAGAAAARAMR